MKERDRSVEPAWGRSHVAGPGTQNPDVALSSPTVSCLGAGAIDVPGLIAGSFLRDSRWSVNTWPAGQRTQPVSNHLDCGDEHYFTYVGRQLELVEHFPGLTNLFALRATSDPFGAGALCFPPVAGAVCSCWGEKLAWRQSRFTYRHGLGDLVAKVRDGPGRGDG